MQKMYRVPAARAWWPAVGARLERRVRPHWWHDARRLELLKHLEHSGRTAALGQARREKPRHATDLRPLNVRQTSCSRVPKVGKRPWTRKLRGGACGLTQRRPPHRRALASPRWCKSAPSAALSCLRLGQIRDGCRPALRCCTLRTQPGSQRKELAVAPRPLLLANPRSRRLCGLTFELSGRQRQDAKPGPVKMYSVPPARAWWPAVGAPLERGVRAHRRGWRRGVPT